MGSHEAKSFCKAKDNVNWTKGLPTEWEKIFVVLVVLKKEFFSVTALAVLELAS